MRKNIHFGASLAIIIIISLAAYALVSWQTRKVIRSASELEQSIPSKVRPDGHSPANTVPADIKAITYDLYPGGDKEISVKYPVLKPGYASASMTAKINQDIASISKSSLESSISDLKESLKAEEETASTDQLLESISYAQEESLYANAGTHVFSFSTYSSGYSGGAHGMHYYSSYAVDTETGKHLSLSDLLEGKYLPVVNSYIQKVIADQVMSDEPRKDCKNCERLEADPDHMWWNKDITPTYFTLNADGITFLFGDYELGPYAGSAGGQEIFVPKDALRGFIRRDW